MKSQDIIAQMAATLPRNSGYFSNSCVPSSFSTSGGGLVTVTTSAPHKILSVGDQVTISGVLTPVTITTATVNLDGTIDFVTATAHDLTLNVVDPTTYVRITGTSFDQTYQLIGVDSRYKFKVQVTTQPALPVGTIKLQQAFLYGYNGKQTVLSIADASTFTFQLTEQFGNPVYYTGAKISTNIRVSGAISIDVITEAYTKQALDDMWAFVVLNDFTGNKDRMNPLDTNYATGISAEYRQRIIAGFNVYIIVPNKGEILTKTNGRAARDIIEDIRKPLFQSLLGIDFGSGLTSGGQNVCTWAGDRAYQYTGAYYIHEFSFQQVFDITYGDTAIVSDHRAFRDIDLSLKNQFSDLTAYTASINLDVNP